MRLLLKSLSLNKWPNGTGACVAAVIAGVAMLFWRLLVAGIIGMILILGGGVFLLWEAWPRKGLAPPQQRRRKHQASVAALITVACFLFAVYRTWLDFWPEHVSEARLVLTEKDVSMGIGQPIKINIRLVNSGDATATRVFRVTRLQFERTPHAGSAVPLTEAEDRVFDSIGREMAQESPQEGIDIPVGDKVFF